MMTPSKCKLFLLCVLGASVANGCGGQFPLAQPLEIEQGNLLEEEDIEQITVGMSRNQVRQRLGTPVLEHAFEDDRWDYLYERRGSQEARKRLTLHFDGDELVEIEDHWTSR
ncbi:outer membrane protein assembly factor BamE [Halorhodospira halophila]|uniref:Outer membrane protein assembly factor BamE n=1 Tax=Halorhodospira halophila (strain DSM 244 / SL1) TaxID=349124 RepID=A1WX37_HALHL|nr:outer membrane protein assembly factor BamE [Halorhodospira halophila]ABM62249.1 SmpA/OmlA domain protein [Halorhodospira halophila SL1]MBK1729224.1 outer membrane protein assembly factor BamE [Halorhodospira halophila]